MGPARTARRGPRRWPGRGVLVGAISAVVAAAVLGVLGALLWPSPRRPASPAAEDRTVAVASFNFPESELLATVYALALENAGVPVQLELDLGPRELVAPALHQGLVDVVPEYVGAALTALVPATSADRGDPVAARRALADALAPWDVQVLQPAPGQDQDGFAVTQAAAERLGVRTLSDLGRVAPTLTLTGPSECPTRPYCLAGLRSVYGMELRHFLPLDDSRQRIEALRQGVADVAVVFTTDAELRRGDLVLLEDDRRLQPVENVVPVVSTRVVERYGTRLTATLDAVSSRLTSDVLAFLDWRVAVHGGWVEDEARAWLQREGLVPR